MEDFGEKVKKGKKGKITAAVKAANPKNPPYDSRLHSTGKTVSDPYEHVILIYGLDTRDLLPSKHYVFVKNTYGKGWGNNGVSRRVVDDLKEVVVPRFDHEDIEQIRSEERESKVLKAAYGVADQTIICPEILDKGELQVAGKERYSQLSNQFKNIATIVMQTTINAETRCPYTVSMIEHLMHEVHFAVDPNSTSKKQAQDVILELQKHYPIKRSPMRLKLTLPVQDFSLFERKLIKWESIIFSRIESGGHRSIVCEIDPGLFHDCDAFVSSLRGRSEILSNSVHGEGDINADHYDVSSRKSKEIQLPPIF